MWWFAVLACRQNAPMVVDPPAGAMSGYAAYTLDLTESGLDANQVAAAQVGPHRAWNLVAEDAATLSLFDQGSDMPGPADVVLTLADGSVHAFADAFTYEPAADALFDRVVAFGASLTQGVQGGVPVHHGVLHSPAHLFAKQAGAYLPLPLLVDPLFPTIGWQDIGAAPDCLIPDVVNHVARAAIEVFAILEDEENNRLGFYNARVDPDIEVHNVAVGDTEMASILNGPPNDPAELFVVKMVYEPYADLLAPVQTSQLSLIEGLAPTMILSTDLYGNDLIKGIVLSSKIDPNMLTPLDVFEADLEVLIDRLAATGAAVYLANMPRVTLLPATATKRAAEILEAREGAIARGEDPAVAEAEAAADIDDRIAQIEARGLDYNAALERFAGLHDNIYVVDFAEKVAQLERDGLLVDGVLLDVGSFGGLLSTDGVHFGDVGYGMIAQLFADAVSETKGISLPAVDLAALYATDPYSPDAARSAGFDPEACAVRQR